VGRNGSDSGVGHRNRGRAAGAWRGIRMLSVNAAREGFVCAVLRWMECGDSVVCGAVGGDGGAAKYSRWLAEFARTTEATTERNGWT